MSGAQRFGERRPERIEAGVGHLEEPTHVRRLVAVEEDVRGRRVAVLAVDAFEHAEGDERVEEVVNPPGMEVERRGKGLGVERSGGEVGEEPDLDSAQEGLGPPERQAELQDRFWGDVVVHARSMRDVPSDSLRTEAIRS